MRPAFRIIANGSALDQPMLDRVRSITVTDVTGYESDTVEVVLADYSMDRPVEIPPTGAELEVFLGYAATGLQRMGLYIADEVEVEGWPGQMTIRGRAAPYDKSKGGKTDLQTQKTRDWPKGTKLSAMVQKIAKEHGLKPVVAPTLANITLPHFDQTNESDVSFLVRVVRKYDGAVKPGGGNLTVVKRGESKSASGEDMPTVTVTAQSCTRWRMNRTTRETGGTVVAFYHDRGLAKRMEVQAGNGDPVRQLRHNFPDKETAQRAAQGELDKRNRRKNRLVLTMPGDPSLAAEAKLKLAGFRAGVPTDWVVSRVEHRFSTGSGYSCDVECETPKED